MGRGVSSGGGQSSLGYLFGSGEEPPRSVPLSKPVVEITPPPPPSLSSHPAPPPMTTTGGPLPLPPSSKESPDVVVAAGINKATNNYHRADGQNSGNFITDRPSTKVHAAPGGGSSLGYLFGSGEERP